MVDVGNNKGRIQMADSPERDTDEIIENVEVPIYHGLNIHQRLNAARGDLMSIEKSAVHEIKKDGKKVGQFNYITHDDVTAAVKPVFLKWGISPWHDIIDHRQNGNRTELLVETTLTCVDQPDDFCTMRTLGYGVDNQDKGPGKAETYAVKTAFLKAMLLNSAEDIEGVAIEHDPEIPRQSQVTAAEGKATAAQISWANTYKQALDSADSIDVLDDVIKKSRVTLSEMPEATKDYFKGIANDIRKEMLEG